MGYGDRNGDRGQWRGENRDDWDRNREREGSQGRDDDRGFFERAGEEVRSWFGGDRDDDRPNKERSGDRGYGRDPYDRDPGSHVDYYRGGDRGQRRTGPEGGFEMRDDYRRSARHSDQGKSWGRGGSDDDRGFSNAGTGGVSDDRQRGFGGGAEGGFRGGGQQHDPHYSEWRRRQIEALDKDYDEYRRENASRFESEFGSWREKRGQQRRSLNRARPQMEVLGSDGQHLGTVDKVAGDRIILARNDENAGGHHHSIPCSWIESVDEKVTISRTAEQAMQAWRDEETSRALFEKRDSGSEGPHILERSFSGTYKEE